MLTRSLVVLLGVCSLLIACAESPPGSPTVVPTIPATRAAVDTAATPSSRVAAPATSRATALLADNRATANPGLVTTELQVPDGFRFSPRTVSLPPGFSISLLAAGLAHPRFMTFDPAGNLLVADQSGSVFRYQSAGGAIVASPNAPTPLMTGLTGPSSLVVHQGYLYVGETTQISRYRYDPVGQPGVAQIVVPNLPTGGHSTRTVVFGPSGKLYVSVGSSCNICDESDTRRAAILRYNADGTGYERFASGLRNAVGLAFQPGSGLLWATVNERDNQGNEIPPDLVTIVREGDNFGWPRCQPPHATPQSPGDTCSGITPPTIGIQAHSAPLGLTFYTGQAFPTAYQSDLFVAQHGSWNRQPPAAPKLLRVHFDGGRPTTVKDFATGWQTPDNRRWGRPVGIVQAPDGSLIVSDDAAGVLYRIRYGG